MILAAGLGTRLRPLTNDRPKALVEVSGHTLLEITLLRLRNCGVREVIVNAHHFADLVMESLKRLANTGMRIEVSREKDLLDTGGGLKKAAWFFLESGADSEQPFILHNVDVLSNIDLGRMVQFHREQGTLATMAVQDRPTSRPLLFDDSGWFRGRAPKGDAEDASVQRGNTMTRLAFSGIHVISPRIFQDLNEDGAFSIIEAYSRLASLGEKILAFRADSYYWRDLGRPENITAAERDIASGLYSFE